VVSLIGQTVSYYKILEKLGEGEMGVVYKAKDLKLDRHVAPKFFPSELTRESLAQERFINEVQAGAAPQHGNICVVYAIHARHRSQTNMAVRVAHNPIEDPT
jgi:serine/threonine protein kinase